MPYQHWKRLPVFHDLVHSPNGTTVRAPLVTLSGRVGAWETWVVAGERGLPLVATVRLPGLRLRRLELQRQPGVDHDAVAVFTQDEHLRDLVTQEPIWEFLGTTLPSFARLVIEADTVALVTLNGVAPRPWRADAMVSCVLGVADLLPVEALLEDCGHEPSN